jgi:hypothetical protein
LHNFFTQYIFCADTQCFILCRQIMNLTQFAFNVLDNFCCNIF